MSGGQIIGLVTIICLFGGPMLVGITHAIVKGLTNAACHRQDVALKQRLADEGFSVDEIERVVMAGRGTRAGDQDDDDGYPKAAKCG